MVFAIEQYLKNPMGSGSSIMPSDTIKKKYAAEFNEIRSSMTCYWYQIKDDYVAHITIPSKTTQGLSYDVVFDFGDISNVMDLKRVPVKVFSNSPSFIFTYAKVFKDQGILCDWLEDKYTKKILALDPSTRNKYKIISYEKSLYLACLYIASNRSIYMFAKMNAIVCTDYTKIKKKVRSERALKNARNRATKKAKKAKAMEKDNKRISGISEDNSVIHSSEDDKQEPATSKITKKTPSTKAIKRLDNRTPSTKKVKKTKKI